MGGEADERQCAPTIDVESIVTRMDTPDCPERNTAQMLVEKVTQERRVWVISWGAQIVNRANAFIEEVGVNPKSWEDVVGCAPGSCLLRVGERVIARFIVRFDEANCTASVEADWPKREVEEGSELLDRTGKHRVVYQQMSDRVAWACEELDLEGNAEDVEGMKRLLIARYGMRFYFEPLVA